MRALECHSLQLLLRCRGLRHTPFEVSRGVLRLRLLHVIIIIFPISLAAGALMVEVCKDLIELRLHLLNLLVLVFILFILLFHFLLAHIV